MAAKEDVLGLISPEDVTSIDTEKIDDLIGRIIQESGQNYEEIGEMALECSAALSSAQTRSSAMASRRFFRRGWDRVTGKDDQLRNAIDRDNAAAQYAMQQMRHRHPGQRTALHHRRGGVRRAGGGQQQGKAADRVPAGKAAETPETLPETTKNHRRSGVYLEEWETVGPVQYLAGYEGPVRLRRGGAGEGVPPQPAAPVRPDVLLPGEGHIPAGGHPGPHRRQHHPHLHRRERRRPRPADRALGAGSHIILVLL